MNQTTTNNLITQVRQAGIVGEGGAGFPAHVKYDTQADTVIANGCECEPLLFSDQHIMAAHTRDVVRGMAAVMDTVGAARGVIGIKAKYREIGGAFEAAVQGTGIELARLENFYPAGDEQILIHEITGKTVPPLGLPTHLGIVVANVGSLYAVANAMEDIPVTQKVVTVTGEVNRPGVITVPVGTPIRACIEFCGGPAVQDPVVIVGGPMMGRFLSTREAVDAEVVTKTSGGLILLPRGHFLEQAARLTPRVMQKRAANACIQCRMCSDLCPRFLVGHGFETHRVMRVFAGAPDRAVEATQAMMCCECGVCELFACPMGLSPRRINAFLKSTFREKGIAYEGEKQVNHGQATFREFRRVPTPRLASRTGLSQYMGLHPEYEGQPDVTEVCIPLRQHIGAPGAPVVNAGDEVATGQCIAEIPEGKLGARIHASISGTVTTVDNAITIRGN